MQYLVTSDLSNLSAFSCVVAGVFNDLSLTRVASKLDELSDGGITKFLAKGDFKGGAAEALLLFDIAENSPERVLLVGCGNADELDADVFNKLNNVVSATLKKINATTVFNGVSEIDVDAYWSVRRTVQTYESSAYKFDQLKTPKPDEKSSSEITLSLFVDEGSEVDANAAIAHGLAITAGMTVCRDVMNLPPNICNPRYLAEQALALADQDNVVVDVVGEDQMRELKMGSYLAVGQGSVNESVMSVIKYTGADNKDAKPIVLVGKGLTFDSGGISIKPSANMDEMKYDMGGAASVLGAMKAIIALQLPVNVIGVLAGCENMPGGNAYRPGDVLTTMAGKTVEVVNTDAEGRLVLCDALTYVERFEPECVIDVATLTGACMVALGKRDSGLFTDNNELATALLKASQSSDDYVWRMPLHKSHKKELESPFADICHAGGRYGGAITAAAFLWEFTEKYPWVHLDIAGTAWVSGKNKGATGRPVPLLTQFILDSLI